MLTTEQLQQKIRKVLAKYGRHTMTELLARLEMQGASGLLRTAMAAMPDVKSEGNTKARRYWVEVSK